MGAADLANFLENAKNQMWAEILFICILGLKADDITGPGNFWKSNIPSSHLPPPPPWVLSNPFHHWELLKVVGQEREVFNCY